MSSPNPQGAHAKVACPVSDLGIPQDVIDAAQQVGMDAKALVELCVQHTVDAARDWLNYFAGKLPAGGK